MLLLVIGKLHLILLLLKDNTFNYISFIGSSSGNISELKTNVSGKTVTYRTRYSSSDYGYIGYITNIGVNYKVFANIWSSKC